MSPPGVQATRLTQGRDSTSQDHHRRHLCRRCGRRRLHDALHSTDPVAVPGPRLADTDPSGPISHHRTQTDKATPTTLAAPRQLHFATPEATHQAGTCRAHFTAAPAGKVGWYMTVLNDCS
jgi:hypothetical protein